MRALIIANPELPVPPPKYGGTERMVSLLADELRRRGVEVRLLAGPGSRQSGDLLIHHPPAAGSRWSRLGRKAWFQALSLHALKDVDVVLNCGRVDYLWSLLRTDVPLVQRFGNPITQDEVTLLTRPRPGPVRLVSITDAQRRAFNPFGRWTTIYNGIDLARLAFTAKPAEPYLAFLGRLTFNKGVDLAIDVAKATNQKLKIAGNVSNEGDSRQFFEREVRARLGDGVEWVGEIGDAEKSEFLSNASAVLFPIRWEEPFGIVIAEALACGTPVIATRRGSCPELIEQGKTGFLCESIDELAAAVRKVKTLDRAECRRACEQRFGSQRMTQDFIRVFEEVIAERKPRKHAG